MSPTPTFSDDALSHIKGRIGEIYLEALCLSQNYSCTSCKGQDYDSLGVDYLLTNFPQGEKRDSGLEDCIQLNIQVKGTSISSESMFKEKENYYSYTLGKSIFKAAGIKTYIFVICAPEEEKCMDWITLEADKILLYSKAYYYEVPAGGIGNQTKIQIPKTNILNKESLVTLFNLD